MHERHLKKYPLGERADSWPSPKTLRLGAGATLLAIFLDEGIPILHTLESFQPKYTRDCTIFWMAGGFIGSRAEYITSILVPATRNGQPMMLPMHFFAEWGDQVEKVQP